MDTLSKPIISVSIITYQHVEFISQCLESILAQQTDYEFEILIGEDGSTDGTREICLEYAKKFPNKIRLFLHDPNRENGISGAEQARKNAVNNIQKARGKYIAFCEGDDYWTNPNKLQKQVDFLEKNLDYVLCWTRFESLDNTTGDRRLDNNSNYFPNENGIDFDFKIFAKGWHIGMQTLVYSKDALLKNNHLNNKYYKDVFLISDLLTTGKGYCLNEVTATYRLHDGGIYSSTSELSRAEIGAFTYREIYNTYKDNKQIKSKYINFNELYIKCLIKNKLVKNALMVLDEMQDQELIKHKETQYIFIENNFLKNNTIIGQQEKQLKHIYNSSSFKIGRAITMPVRWLIDTPNKIKILIHKLTPTSIKNKNTLKRRGVVFINKKEIINGSKNLKALPSLNDNKKQKIIVSLTSFPERISDIFFNLYSLLNQKFQPDMIILWLAEEQFPRKEKDIPKRVLNLQQYGLTIRWCKDIKSYKKLIYSLQEYPDDIIVTADDDIYYPENWLELLYNSYLREPEHIHCHRAHRITFNDIGNIDLYKNWSWCISSQESSYLNFCTTGGGVLYPPGSLYKDVFNEQLFIKLCPTADDIWFWAMAVLNNTKIRIIDNNITNLIYTNPEIEFGFKNGLTLFKENLNANNEQLKNVLEFYNALFIDNKFSAINSDSQEITLT